MDLKIIDKALLDNVASAAENNPRRRMNYNFHEKPDDPINRLLNVMMEDTYIPPHRHTIQGKDEIMLVLQGSVLVLLFDDEGQVIFSKEINPAKGVFGAEFDGKIWHSLIVLEPATVIYEVKQGPYVPATPNDFAPWAPSPDNKEEARSYTQHLLEKYRK